MNMRMKFSNAELQARVEQVMRKWIQKDDIETDQITEGSIPGACVFVKAGDNEAQYCAGWSLRYSDAEGHNLDKKDWIPMAPDKIFDLASITKIWTTLCFFILQKEHNISIETPVYEILPGFLENNEESVFDKKTVLIRHIMAHMSGFHPEPTPLLDSPEMCCLPVSELRKSVISNSLVTEPGTHGIYSDVNYLLMGFIIETVSGTSLDKYMNEKLIVPMGLQDSGFNVGKDKFARVVANEYSKPERVLGRPQPIRGTVHDEKGHLFNGVAGHAGMYSTLEDMKEFCELLLNKGFYNGKQIVDADLLENGLKCYTSHLPGYKRGLGFELDSHFTMGKEFCALPGIAYGHTGFTGTSFVINNATRSYVILLTNRTHPNRDISGSCNPARVEFADLAAEVARSE
ncbi:unnamed protein product [Kuraishia capsulata CBS 1993]|uniref:Beta-lactamase-related domain-containing protein n=1 Tax=Kuraishia capsulata CBS 1993 TaxID=1382522 RepID=W6MTK2_9ASCO|nr:uncharacterized protein KUCA_T00001067001 [Kuraishia capsulata CBS 1993]CDK25100.1 unnamed protein product [Kuraishia capsulata CBS 1993]